VTVDAAINGGNSGGPAISKGKVCGVSFQGLRDAQSVGYIIPSSVLRRTIEDFTASEASAAVAAAATAASASAAGAAAVAPAEVATAAPLRSSRKGVKLRGFATFAPSFQTMENEALRRANGLDEAGASGVLLYAVPRVSNLRGVLEEGDVLVAVDGERISNDGRVKRGENSPMDFRVCVTMKLVGEPICYSIVRAGQRREVEAAAERAPELTPAVWYGPAQYCIFAGLVFIPATDACEFPIMHAPYSKSRFLEAGRRHEHARQQLPVLVSLLPHSVLLGYERREYDVFSPLLTVDGEDVLCLADVHRLCRASKGPYTTFRFARGRCIVLPTAEGRAATAELMHEHRIASDASDDIVAATGAAAVCELGGAP